MSASTGRRPFLALAALPLLSRQVRAQGEGYPSHPITLINPYPPGGLTDTTTRALAERMGRELGQTIVVDNRPGGATSPANTAAAAARPDGYTLLMGSPTLAINPALQPGLTPQEPRRVLVPIAVGYRSPQVLHVHPSVPATTLAEFIAYTKANPGRVNYGSSGIGSVNHLAMELLCNRAGLEMTHIPYRGGAPALLDLRSGRIQAMFSAVLEAMPTVKDGVTRALAVSSPERIALLPDLPTLAATIPGFDVAFWQGMFAPSGTPEAVVGRLEAAMLAATRDAVLVSRLAEQGVSIAPQGREQLAALLDRETETWARLIRDAGIKPE